MSTGELEPKDSRNVTGTSANQTGDRWSRKAQAMKTPEAAGAIASGEEPGRGGPSFTDAIAEHMPVVGSDGAHVGTVDAVEQDRIRLTKSDAPAGHEGHHHYLPLSEIAEVDAAGVHLRSSARAAIALATAH